jgi:hypothetical protein
MRYWADWQCFRGGGHPVATSGPLMLVTIPKFIYNDRSPLDRSVASRM